MSRQREREREAERARLLGELERDGLTPALRDRIARFVADDVDRAWSGRSVAARQGQLLGVILADMLAASGINDAEPPTEVVPRNDGYTEVFVRSRSRGRVSLGVLSQAQLRAAFAQVVPMSRAEAAGTGSDALESRTARRIRRTAELTAAGLTAREIGKAIAADEGSSEAFAIDTVKTWRKLARSHRT